ncbi:polysaccharide biosynthesis/export family protein [Almyronema epifaneia]|uniref:Polysaccharide biosynthesis/export family protein n=1 Tax=Almyronema epifaneia S1 TaxID=2991925 RepID=A0ABW6IAU9_9CYAN
MFRCLSFKPLSLAALVAAGWLSHSQFLQPAIAQSLIRPLPPPAQDGIALPTPVNSPDYILGSGDALAISVIGYPEFDIERIILPDGSVSIPLVGSVPAAGRTLSSLTTDLDARLRRFLVNPVVSVSLNQTRPVIVNIAGEVYRPGPAQLTGSGSSTGIPTLSQALIAAGGVQRDADIRQVTVERTNTWGQRELITVNFWEALTSNTDVKDILLRDGDSVFVPQLTAESAGIDQRLVASSSLAPTTIRVRVVGEVRNPGEVLVPPNSSISSAVAVAGGPTTDARLSDVALVRLNEEGLIEEQVVDLDDLVDNYQVQDGDVIFVAKRSFPSVLDFLGRVSSGILAPLSLLNFLTDF